MALVTIARAMLEAATVHKDVLVSRGPSEALLAQVGRGIEEFEQTLEAAGASMEHRKL